MRHKKAQALALAKIVTAAIVLLVLIVVAVVGVGMIKKGFNNLLCAVDLCKEAEGSGDYILRTSVEFVDEDHVILHFTPNPTRCAEIRETNPYKISQAYVPYGEDYIPEGDYEEVEVVGGKGDCGKEVLVPGHEGGEPIALVQPDEFGTHLLKIDVYGDEQEGFPLKSVPVEVNEWERLLMTYLTRQMSRMDDTLFGRNALRWSLIMHTNPGVLETSHPGDQSMNLASGSIREIEDLLGLSGDSIEDIEGIYDGTFQDFLVKMGCAYPEDHTDILQDPQVKRRTLRAVVTALFGDIQDFDWQSGQTHHINQPVPRLRNGVGIRGYASTLEPAYRDLLLPTTLFVNYPGTGLDTNGFTLFGRIMGYVAVDEGPKELGATFTFDSPENSCFRGDPITVELKYCPESTCKIALEGEEEASNRCATEIDVCNAESVHYPNCCPATDSLPAVTPAGSYYTRGGACYHCQSSGQWEDGTADDSMCTICALPEGPLP